MNNQPTTKAIESGTFFNKLHKSAETRLGKITTSVAIVFGAATLSACSEPPAPKPATTQSPEDAAPVVEVPADPELVTELKDLGWEAFNQLDPNVKRPYALYKIKTGAERHERITADKNRATWTTPSRDMDGQAILDNWMYIYDEAGLSTEFDAELNDQRVNPDEAIKVLSAAYYDTSEGVVTNSYLGAKEQILGATSAFLAENNKEEVSTSELQKGVDVKGNPIEYKTVVFTNTTGETQTARFVYAEFPGVNEDETEATWLLLDLNEVQ